MSRFRSALFRGALFRSAVAGAGLLAAGAAASWAASPGTAPSGAAEQRPAAGPPAGSSTGAPAVGRIALPAEIAAWNIDVRPDGQGLPAGSGTARQGEAIFGERCAACHGEFGEGAARWPALAGGQGSLRGERPEKTIGSFWPYASTVFDYVHRAMPYGNAQSLEPDETYAVVAYLLSLNDVVTDPDQVLDARTLAAVRLPNEPNFFDDDREVAERQFWGREACMRDCKPGAPQVLSRARALDVTPEGGASGPKVE